MPFPGGLHTAYTQRLAVYRAAGSCSLRQHLSLAMLHGVRHGHHTRRAAPDPLAPMDAPTWLIVRDMCGLLLELTELPPRADQRAVLMAAREAWMADGWRADEVGPHSAFFFAARAGERIMVGIERDPMRRLKNR